MTQAERVYADTLNLFGSDLHLSQDERDIQDIIDGEHALADPVFARVLARRWTMRRLTVN